MKVAQASLTIVNVNTDKPGVFWNGKPVPGVNQIKVEWERGDRVVVLRVNGSDDTLYMEMVAAGIRVKKGK